jgi:hypothetical protein
MNVSYFELALKYQGIDVTKPEDAEKMVAALEVYEKKFNKSSTPVRVALNRLLASSPDFKRKLLQYLRPLIIKGVPSVLHDLKSFYKNEPEKTKILGSAIGKNSLGFFDVAGSEVVEELPETILQIGAALMTGGTTLAAKGTIAVIGAAGSIAETFGSTVEETFKKSLKAGDDKSVAMNKAYLNGVLSTAIEAGTNYVADKAMLAPFLNKFTGTLAGTATGFVSSTTIGAASELAAGFSQSYATQYIVNPATASLSKAATDGIFEMFIGGTAQGGTSLPGYAIQGGAIIGKDYFGKELFYLV